MAILVSPSPIYDAHHVTDLLQCRFDDFDANRILQNLPQEVVAVLCEVSAQLRSCTVLLNGSMRVALTARPCPGVGGRGGLVPRRKLRPGGGRRAGGRPRGGVLVLHRVLRVHVLPLASRPQLPPHLP